uniref:Uncharacterized protein n=1 Tax=Sciurus vulgaris TaxID=55149 RepID=A0A8D2JMQ2_SCIVU
MSSTDEASGQEDGFGLDGAKHTIVPSAGPRAPRVPGVGLELGPPRSGEGEGGLPDPEEIEAGGAVLRGGEGGPSSTADKKEDALDFVPHLPVESVATVQQQTGQETPSARRYRSPESWVAELSAIWANAEAGPSWRGTLAPGSLETPQAPSAAPPRHPSGPEVGRAWGNPERGTKTRMMGSGEGQPPPSHPEFSDELSEIQLVRVSLCPKEGQASSSSPREPGDTASRSSVGTRGNFLQIPVSLPTSAPGRLTSAMERQALAELEACSSKKRQSMIWGKGESRPSYPGAAAAVAAAAAAVVAAAAPPPPPPLPPPAPAPKAIQEKKSLGGGSKFSLGRAFPPWGQILKAAPLEPAILPPIPGVPLFGRSKRYSLLPLEPMQPKHSGAGKRSMAKKTQESQPVASDDHGPNRDTVPTTQVTHRPGTPYLCMHPGEFSSGDPNTRVPQPLGSSQPLDLNQGGLTSRDPAPSGECCELDRRGEGQDPLTLSLLGALALVPGFPAYPGSARAGN